MISEHCSMRILRSVGAALVLATLTPATASAFTTTGSCSPSRVRYAVSDSFDISVDSPTYKNMRQAAVTFTQGGTAPSCVLVRFSAGATSNGDSLLVRAVIDDAIIALPPERLFMRTNEGGQQTVDFVFPSIAPGTHILRIQGNSDNATAADVNFPMIIIHHAP
jgi:hypothetical protein